MQSTTEVCILGVPTSRELRIRSPSVCNPSNTRCDKDHPGGWRVPSRTPFFSTGFHSLIFLKFCLKRKAKSQDTTLATAAEVMKPNKDDNMYFIWIWSRSSNFYDFLGSFLCIKWMENDRVCEFSIREEVYGRWKQLLASGEATLHVLSRLLDLTDVTLLSWSPPSTAFSVKLWRQIPNNNKMLLPLHHVWYLVSRRIFAKALN